MKTATRTSKYNVKKDKSGRTYCDGDTVIIFDSELEKKYFTDVVLPGIESGEMKNYELQHKYILLPAFVTKDGRKIREVAYYSDFELEFSDKSHLSVDIKGMWKPIDSIKEKLIRFRYPETNLRYIGYSKIDGGWTDYATIQENRRKRKKLEKQFRRS